MEMLTFPLNSFPGGQYLVRASWHCCLKVLQHERQDPKIQRVDGNLRIECTGLLDPNCVSLTAETLSVHQIGNQNST